MEKTSRAWGIQCMGLYDLILFAMERYHNKLHNNPRKVAFGCLNKKLFKFEIRKTHEFLYLEIFLNVEL